MSYAAISELSNKLISFPDIKKLNLLCKQCIFETSMEGISSGTLSVRQITYGIATVVKMTCRNGHVVEIVPKMINENDKWDTKNVAANYKLLLLMQLLGKGLKGMAIITALLGIHSTLGNYKPWKDMQDKLGEIEMLLAKNVVRKIWKRRSRQQLKKEMLKLMKIGLTSLPVVTLDGREVGHG